MRAFSADQTVIVPDKHSYSQAAAQVKRDPQVSSSASRQFTRRLTSRRARVPNRTNFSSATGANSQRERSPVFIELACLRSAHCPEAAAEAVESLYRILSFTDDQYIGT